jgi:hypothetical protein
MLRWYLGNKAPGLTVDLLKAILNTTVEGHTEDQYQPVFDLISAITDLYIEPIDLTKMAYLEPHEALILTYQDDSLDWHMAFAYPKTSNTPSSSGRWMIANSQLVTSAKHTKRTFTWKDIKKLAESGGDCYLVSY